MYCLCLNQKCSQRLAIMLQSAIKVKAIMRSSFSSTMEKYYESQGQGKIKHPIVSGNVPIIR